ncbi:arginine/ornithine ABC transporter permease [Pseudomonas aeruginosa SD9]|nr:arginine/ornithine ABC transporter permease [Pseudomonas aeruginosa SD9]
MITGYGATIVDGAWLTLQLALLSMLLAIVLGLLGAAFPCHRCAGWPGAATCTPR